MPKKNTNFRKNIIRVLKYVSVEKWLLVLSFLFSAAVVSLTLYFPVLSGRAVDLLIGEGKVDFDKLADILLSMGRIVLANMLFQWIVGLCNNAVTFKTLYRLRQAAFSKLWRLPMSYIEQHKTGELLSIAMTDTETISDGLLLGLSQLFEGVLMIAGTLVFMFSLNVKIAILVVVITPISLLTASFTAKRIHEMFIQQSKARAAQTSLIEEVISNQKVVIAYRQQSNMMVKFNEVNDKLAECSLRATFYSSIVNPATRFVNGIVYAVVCVFGATSVISGRGLSIGQLTAFLSYATSYTKPFNEISSVITELSNSVACANRLFMLLDTPDEIDKLSGELISCKNDINMKNVYFSYNIDKPFIQDFTLKADVGQKIAIVGPTGCGKTTLINLLMRFLDPQSGSIEISGTDVNKVPREEIRKNIGMVLQDTWLKNASIRDNLLMSKPDANDNEIIEAAKLSHAYDFIKRLPNKLDTIIGDGNDDLSAGQKQLLCITRIMLSPPPMLILDEATSSIDTRTELKIQKAFTTLMKGRTSLIVAHRLSTIRNSDWIIVMKDGCIIEQGKHENLLENKGFYYKLYSSQVKR